MHSRCKQFSFHILGNDDITEILKRNADINANNIGWVALNDAIVWGRNKHIRGMKKIVTNIQRQPLCYQ